MSIYAAVRHELVDAAAQDRPVAHVRVTPDAIVGSVAVVPITPERARNLPASARVPLLGYDQRLLEVLIHPVDYEALLREQIGEIYAVSGLDQICGVPVIG